jgi:hypothetical protein
VTKREAAIVSAYTGFLIGDFSDMHKYIEEKLGRSVWTHELADIKIQEEIKQKSKEDFINIEVCDD